MKKISMIPRAAQGAGAEHGARSRPAWDEAHRPGRMSSDLAKVRTMVSRPDVQHHGPSPPSLQYAAGHQTVDFVGFDRGRRGTKPSVEEQRLADRGSKYAAGVSKKRWPSIAEGDEIRRGLRVIGRVPESTATY